MQTKQSMGDQFLTLVKHIIEDHISDENFSVSVLAREVGLSRSMLHRKLIRHTGKSASELITEIRLSRARDLIENDVATISEIAYSVGFASPSYFNKAFKKRYNTSPGVVRKKRPVNPTNTGSARKHLLQDPARRKRTRFYVFVGIKILVVILVATAAALLLSELYERLALLLSLTERTMNVLIILLIVGFIATLFLSLIYYIKNAMEMGRKRLSLGFSEEGMTDLPVRWKIFSYISIILIVALISLNLIQKDKADQVLDPEISVAVLPFRDDSPAQDNEYFINGMMESILDNLCKIKDLRVPSRGSVEPLRNSGLSIQELAAKLNVHFLLMGSVQKYGDNIRLTLLLVDESGRQLWSKEYNEEFNLPEKYFNLQSMVARQVAASINATIMPEELQKIERSPTTSLRALGLYRKGREEYISYFADKARVEALRSAAAYYRSALEVDPAYGQAYAGLALALQNLYMEELSMNMDISETGIRLQKDTILRLADQALSLDPYLEEACLARGNYYYMINDYNRALEEYDKALQINPNFSLAYDARSNIIFYHKNNWIGGLENKLKAIELERGDMQVQLLSELGDYYEIMGFPDMAREVYGHTFNLTGDSARYFFDMAGPAYCEQNWKEQISWFRRSLERDSTQPWPLGAMSDAYRLLGNNDSANYFTSQLIKRGKLGTQGGLAELNIYQLLLEEGRIDSANQVLDKVEDYLLDQINSNIGNKDYCLQNLINAYCLRNMCDKAMEYLKQMDTHALKPLYLLIEIENLPGNCSLYRDPEYQRILNSLKTTREAEHERVRQWLEENEML